MKFAARPPAAKLCACALVCLMALDGATAQDTKVMPLGPTQAASRGQASLDKYMAQLRGSTQGVEALEEASANGIARTRQNSIALRELIGSSVTTEEKLVATRLLARQYSRGDPTGMNQVIAQDLRHQSKSSDPSLARAATLAFSRLGYFPDYQDVLIAARNRGIVDDDTYFGELAHVLVLAPSTDQERLARDLQSSKNGYASLIVADRMSNASVVPKIPSATQAVLSGYLEATEPQFSMALGQFDFVAAGRYSTWLRAAANLQASDANKQGAELIMARLNDLNIDPRKVMAFLGWEFGPTLISQIGQKARFDSMLQRISLYAKQHPQNTDMQEIVDMVKTRLGTCQ